jgi:DNA helicase-4
MFEFVTNWINAHKEKVCRRNCVCDTYFARANDLCEAQEKLFGDVRTVVDMEQAEKWEKNSAELIVELNAEKQGIWLAKNYRELKKVMRQLKEQVRLHNARVMAHDQLVEDNRLCDQFMERLDSLLNRHADLFHDKTEFIDPEEGNSWSQAVKDLHKEWLSLDSVRMSKTENFSIAQRRMRLATESQFSIQKRIHQHNDQVAEQRAKAAYALIGDVEGRRLDSQQLNCIVKKAHNHLVIAGAGTGKTTTVVGKIKYLLRSKQCNPSDILVLSFTNASATEMNQRISAETGEKIEASTFHKLGLNIIAKVNGVMPKITQINLRKFVQEQILENMRSDAYLAILGRYLLSGKVNAKSEFEFESKAEYEEYLKLNPPVTLRKEAVKSYGEMDIANFLSQNGIAYLYEFPYAQDTRTEEYAQYHPDFYLPEHKIYIEYFGINRNGEVPAYFTGKDGKSASQHYRDSMEWKRKLHAENGTVMVECFAYEKREGTLQENLARQLEANGVKLQPVSPQELWKQVAEEGESILDGVVELFETVINLQKSNNYTIEDLRRKNVDSSNQRMISDLLWLLEPIYKAYEQYLKSHGEIDFNDMINIATRYVAEGKYRNPYRYVIVDEYQDISKARFRLLKTLRESQDYDLFCVGDDWQSIYRFAGSDIGFILNFSQYWGASEESKIETTYRFTQSLIEISGNFIMKNPAQKKKAIRGQGGDSSFALSEVNGYTEKYALEFMAQKLEDLPKDSTVFFLGRYSFDSNMLKDSGLFALQYNNQTGFLDVRYQKRPDLKMCFITAHKSKGLQADYVVILNNKGTRMGFPSMIQDSPILDLLLEKADNYPHSEERRLFYVALTRAKKKAILLTIKDKESVFAKELKERYGEELKKENFTCPLCGGKLIRRTGKFGDFFGCSNYTTGQCKYTRNIRWNKQE